MSHCAGNLTAALEGYLHVASHSAHCPVTYNAPVTDGTGGKFIIMEDKQKKMTHKTMDQNIPIFSDTRLYQIHTLFFFFTL